MEHVVLRRLQPFLEATLFLSHAQFGCRPHFSMQDVLLQFKEQSALDNVEQDVILSNLAESHCGACVYNYVQAFLCDRTATVGVGTHRSSIIHILAEAPCQEQ
ncbi:hypothetical protein HPB50_002763 [Hyalomma asiaticum]|uniref:Uncharacterized protein n=1 Tax=Hyalomma asiaticum TaxID=266040 RepID=A0ACB7S4Y0_HYAAI|nr:hypothetical protein HPB50_002763 [Hyalomma asiaticum]